MVKTANANFAMISQKFVDFLRVEKIIYQDT